jgi:hypothetical protein
MGSPGLNRATSSTTAFENRQARRSPSSDFMTTPFSEVSMLSSFPYTLL